MTHPLRTVAAAITLVFASACSTTSGGIDKFRIRSVDSDGPRVLCVVAHPDDEIAFAATLFKTATFLRGTCDIVVITNGEGGYKYSTLGELYYGLQLTDPEVGRAHLPAIRQREHLRGGSILGFRDVTYLNQVDHRYTTEPAEVLDEDAAIWDLELVRSELRRIVDAGDYDFVLTHLPSPQTHGHHQAASILALEAVKELPEARRPVVLGSYLASPRGERPPPSTRVERYPITKFRTDVGPFRFDRTQKFGFKDKLNYQIVVNWAVAEHKSQGSFQTLMNRWDFETFYVYEVGPPDAAQRAQRWFTELTRPQFVTPKYDENGVLLVDE